MIDHIRLIGWLCASLCFALGCQAPERTTDPEPRPDPESQIVDAETNQSADSQGAQAPLVTQGKLYPVDSVPKATKTKTPSPEERIAADVVGYLEEVADRTAALESYTLRFTRYERKRSGFSWKLSGPENMQAWFRREPFSVKLKWLNEDLKYDESVYVAGAHNDMVRFVTRVPVFLLKPPPEINLIDTQTPVIIGETKRPITEFGLEGMLRRTLKSLEEDGDTATTEYRGIIDDPEHGQRVHHIRLTYQRPQNEPSIQDLYIDVETNLPTGSELRLADETLDGGYYYAEIDTSTPLDDEDFLLSVERQPPAETSAVSMQHE